MTPIVLLSAPLWSFTQEDYDSLNQSQRDIIKKSYYIGNSYALGETLAAISIVETRAGAFPDKSRNRICGTHQVDVNVVKKNLNTTTSTQKICKALQDSPVLSAVVSLEILLYWRDNSSSYRDMIYKYSRGWQERPHDEEYFRRIQMTLKVLRANKMETL